jgi:hypothetical protein
MIAAAFDIGSLFHRLTSFAAIFFLSDTGTDGMFAFLSFGSH